MSYEQKKWVARREAIKSAKEKRERDNKLNREIAELKVRIIEMEKRMAAVPNDKLTHADSRREPR